MSEKKSENEHLFEEAFDLVIRLQEKSGNHAIHNEIARWRARDAEHEKVWVRAMRIHGMAGHAIQEKKTTAIVKKKQHRRSFLMGGAALAAVATGAVVAPQALLHLRADYLTTTAQMRNVLLEDGTRVVLGPKTAIRTQMTQQLRHVDVLEGMAYFEVAKDVLRPFEASLGQLHVTALGTAFDLGQDTDNLRIAVTQGLVQVRADARIDAETLSAGQWLSVNGQRTIDRGRTDPGMIASWRNGMLIVENETIATVVSRISRWQSGRVMIADTALGNQRISGVYDLKQPLKAMQAVVQPLGARVRQFSPWLTVITEA
jgi:transmembrane sensor